VEAALSSEMSDTVDNKLLLFQQVQIINI
jgi:hypothetical protein